MVSHGRLECKVEVLERVYVEGFIAVTYFRQPRGDVAHLVSKDSKELSKQTEFVSKEVYTGLLRSFAKLEKHSISLELALQQCQEQMKNDTIYKEKASNVFQKEHEQYFEIQDLKAQLQDKNIAISELKKLIEKCKGKSVETKFDKPSIVRQPNAQRIPKPSVLGKPAPFSDSLERNNFVKKKSVSKTNESEGLSKPVTSQNLPQTASQAVRNTNVIKPGMYQIERVAHILNVSRPWPRSNQMKDKVVPNTSHVKFKKTEVEEHHRISSISNQTKSVTACNDSLNSRTSIVNAVCATCGKCVFNSNHDACVSKFLNDVNARTMNKFVATPHKKPHVVPISSRKPNPYGKLLHQNPLYKFKKSYYRYLEVCFWKSTCFVSDLQGKRLTNRFDEIKEISQTSVANDTSGLVPQRQKASDYVNPDPAPELQSVSSSADTTVPSQQELDLLFGPLYDEFFNDGTSRVNKSSSPTDNSIHKDTLPSTNIQPTSELDT
ncbi:hypothetical protein Tco_1113625 [Tanacetum coccineum]|uniref:Integrase, catalytic region, zinc finger, CCHC-type, peptidase aspartic, catalytic n=1 Tax=Tanacetum coccineum TaxID=301880 RepID=A0ABQ5IV16_9ASTR